VGKGLFTLPGFFQKRALHMTARCAQCGQPISMMFSKYFISLRVRACVRVRKKVSSSETTCDTMCCSVLQCVAVGCSVCERMWMCDKESVPVPTKLQTILE